MKLKSIKTILSVCLLLVMAVSFAIGLDSISKSSTVAAAQKGGRQALITSADLDHAYASGSTVFYQLTDEEDGAGFEFHQGYPYTKVPAIITFNYFDRRDSEGRKVYSLHILRPGFLGGAFDKAEVPADPSRTPGTFDTVQPGDLRN
jgi:hypothetical protein